MSFPFPRLARAAAAVVLAAPLGVPLAAQQAKLPPVRPLGPVTARSTDSLSAIATAVPLPGGKVLVNDVLQRRVVLLDSTLAFVKVVADTSPATGNAYGQRGGGLIGYGGDSALFIDPASLSMMVIDPNGELTTVRAVPRANEINFLSGANGRPGFDPKGGLVYRSVGRPRQVAGRGRQGGGGGVGGPGGMTFQMPELPDSAPVVRVDFSTRQLDTLGAVKVPRPNVKVTQGADGRMNVQTTVDPMPVVDDWALLADGTIALVRGHDFHVDWRAPDGTVTSGAKLPFEWQRLTDEDKERLIDSARTAMEKQREEAQRLMNAAGGPGAFIQQQGGVGALMGGGMGGPGTMITFGGPGMGPGGGGPPQRGAQAAPAGGAAGGQRGAQAGPGGQGGFQIPPINMIPANELPDYRPPFVGQSALGDLDGLLWVRTTAPVGEHGPIYYVIDKDNQVVDRVQVPQGRMIAGFGKGGLVYLSFRDTEGRARLELARK